VRKSFYIIDGHAQIFRSYYAPFRPLTSPTTGEPTKAIHVFCATLFNWITRHKPDYLAMALDVSDESVFRREIDPTYKAHRDPAPEDLAPQAERIIQIVAAMGVPILKKPGFEADDLMATLAHRLAGDDVELYLVSRDKDLEQLITDRVFLFDPMKDGVIDRKRLIESKGYAPDKAVEIQILTGDSVDNIRGVAGIGPKTAAKLIDKYGSAISVIEHADELTPKQRENVLAFAPNYEMTRQLVTLRRDVDFDFDLSSARFDGVDVAAVMPLFRELGFTRLTEQLDGFRNPSTTDPETEVPSTGTTSDAQAATAAETGVPRVDQAAAQRYVIVDDESKLFDLAKQLARQSAFAVDTETTAINPVAATIVGISISWSAGAAYYVPIRAAVGEIVSIDVVQKHLGPIFANPAINKVAQNIKYDWIVLRRAGLPLAGPVFDTMIASFVLEPLRRSHGIDALALELLGFRKIATSELIGKGRDQMTMDMLPVDQIAEYACEDADITWRLYELLAPAVHDSPMRRLFEETEMPLAPVLATMEENGVAIDRAMLARMGNELADRIMELAAHIHKAAGHEFNIDSPKQLARVLFEEQGLKPVKRTKTGPSTDADSLQRIAAASDHPICNMMLEYRELTKLRGTYVETLPKMVCPATGRIHASFHQTGAVTGRLSSSDPNLQNIPIRTDMGRRIREAFVARADDHVLIVADYSQIELRIMAHFSKDAQLLEAFESGQDIHAFVAAQVNNVALDQVTSKQRSAAKAVNFGIIYGQTAFGLARSLGISRTDATDFIHKYFERYPGIQSFINQCIAAAEIGGYVETILGRRRPLPELKSRNQGQQALGKRLAVNTVIQGSAADLIKRAMIDIDDAIRSDGLDLKMLIQVHDELVLESSRARAEDHAAMIKSKMETAMTLDVPIAVDVGIGGNWLAAK